jgi:galactoside O-acetyltransferase
LSAVPIPPLRAWPRALRETLAGLVLMAVRHLPGQAGVRLRWLYYKRRLGALGEGTRIDEGVHLVNPQHIFVGRNCWIAANAFLGAGPTSTANREIVRRPNPDYDGGEGQLHLADHVYVAPQALINAHGGVAVEEDCSISAGAKLFSATHYYRDERGDAGVPKYVPGMRRSPGDQCLMLGPVVIRRGSQVGTHAVVLPGVTIGPRTWLGAGAIAPTRLEPDRVYNPTPVDRARR